MSSYFINESDYKSSINIDIISNQATVSYSSNHKHFYFKEHITAPENTHLILGITNFSMPYMFYQIRENINDTLTITTIKDGITKSVDIVIPEGNYTVQSFVPILNTILTEQFLNLGAQLVLFSDYTKSKFYFTCYPKMEEVIFENNNLYQVLGFPSSSESYSYYNLETFNVPYCYNFAGNSCIYIKLLHHNLHNLNSSNIGDIISCINVNVLPNEFIYYRPSDPQFFKSSKLSINEIEIAILDENFQDINLNGAIFRMTLSVHFSQNKKNKNIEDNIISTNINENKKDENTRSENDES